MADYFSIASLFLEFKRGHLVLATGSGFLEQGDSGRTYLVTARHNVTGRCQDTDKCLSELLATPTTVAIHHFDMASNKWTQFHESLYLNDDENRPRWIEHPELGRKADVVALPVPTMSGTSPNHLEIRNSDWGLVIEPTSRVSVIGFPLGKSAGEHFAIWSTGFVASEPEIRIDGLPMIYIDCRTKAGQSGAPVVAYRPAGEFIHSGSKMGVRRVAVSRFIGIYSGRIHKDSDVGRVWTAECVFELLAVL